MSNDNQMISKTNKNDDINILKYINILKDINYIFECKTPPRTTHSVPPNAPKKVKRRNFWYGEEGICEICYKRVATVNLDLTYGSHRECQSCWDD